MRLFLRACHFECICDIFVHFIVLVSLSEALCPEEAESALEATQFFTDDDTPQGTRTRHVYHLNNI